MKDLFLNNSLALITRYNNKYNDADLEKMRYGLEGIYLTVFKLFIILILSLLLGILKEVLLVLLLYNGLRFFGFGMHAGGSLQCLIISTTLFVLFPMLVFKKFLIFKFSLFIYPLCLLSFILFAPSDTVKRPLVNKKKRLKRKICASIIAFIYIVICVLVRNYSIHDTILTALIIESIMINPVTYKVFKQPYSNYKNYKL